jgi:hypothetical protein
LSVVDQAKQDLEEHMGSQPFDCARCGIRLWSLVTNQVISAVAKYRDLTEIIISIHYFVVISNISHSLAFFKNLAILFILNYFYVIHFTTF